MAKLSRKKGIRVSFLLNQMVLTDDQSQRETILGDLLECLHIDAEQSAESRESARRYLRHLASKKRRDERAAKPVDSKVEPDIDGMSLDEMRTHNAGLRAKLDRMLDRKQIANMTDEERRRYIAELLAKRDEALQQPASAPQPAPTVEDAPQYDLPTKRMEQAVARFDDMSDADQVDVLRGMWGDL